ncbi:AfsA-related hotdog domain-containing protein [Streptomyces flavofungini]|uniref:AfsA-related hotdog domain-containing protein n=1 Tax=Streptomyces flavofungini TaxID=68200 RepID=UPI0025AF0E4D|nr:AfsA-related hotdog domain-containing protein [Streptomyces flavofungini]WJV44117.1 AfsA-related hotdog domain-containing protein [Streptomyces flavofungini]
MHEPATVRSRAAADRWERLPDDLEAPVAELLGAELARRTLGLETVTALLVVSMSRRGSRSFTAVCQWPRLHPLNERAVAVRHHPLIMVESTRQLAMALRHRRLPESGTPPLRAVSVRLGLHAAALPTEQGSATDVAVQLTVSDLAADSGGLAAYRVTAEFAHAARPLGWCSMRFARATPQPPPAAEAGPRAGLLHPPAGAVGAAADTDVLLARAPQAGLVILPRDPGHPILLAGRPALLPAPTVLEAGRQAVMLTSGSTAEAVVGLSVEIRAAVPWRGAGVEVTTEPCGARFAVTVGPQLCATGTVALLRP